MLHYYLSKNNGSFIAQGFVCSLDELSEILLELKYDFWTVSSELDYLSSVISNRSVIFAHEGDCIVTTSLTLELL